MIAATITIPAMSRRISSRLLAQSSQVFPNLAPSSRASARGMRLFSQSASRGADDRSRTAPPTTEEAPIPRSPSLNPASSIESFQVQPADSPSNRLARHFGAFVSTTQRKRNELSTNFASDGSVTYTQPTAEPVVEPHHFHIIASRHNTHITVTSPKRNPIISLSCGNLGFRHSERKHYDSAYQLATFVLQRMQDRGINSQIKELEVILRGFGAGREAVTKALLGLEGKELRHKIVKVADATRLKFGGTRSPKPRRLG
ncbi:hypothetical protein HYFRA_00012382 [Hymenoscyphus fraxineus]|uniref:Small ribosomal subunit protein uS11m n=1 Tax=Hymenoscyphus fraxineus TaxID=746836 RepID=A0A9N9Q018_9HELO|nr:hypothetical protein HYFRA_00012382 [Hymenoscyphus fraxineus]